MIIRHPTALYESQLPIDGNPGNITWTISTKEPAQSNARFIKLPQAVGLTKRPPAIFTEKQRRAFEGSLAYTLLKADQTMASSNQRIFDIGQVLEFSNTDQGATSLAPDPTPEVIAIQHTNSLIDLNQIGLSNDDIALLEQQAADKKRDLEAQLTAIKARIADLSVQIADNQKLINETDRVIDATRQVYGIEDGDESFQNPLYQKLLSKRNNLLTSRDDLGNSYNASTAQSQVVYTSLLQVSELVH